MPHLYADFHLLDRQILDADARLVGKVDDVEFGRDADGVPHVAALLSGRAALGHRIGGLVGRLILIGRPAPPLRIPYALVADTDTAVTLTVTRGQLPEPRSETWLREHLIGRIPGAGDAAG